MKFEDIMRRRMITKGLSYHWVLKAWAPRESKRGQHQEFSDTIQVDVN